MKYYAMAWAFAGLALHAQTLAIAVSPNPSLSPPAVDSRALTAIVSSSVSPDGQIHNTSDLYLLRTDSASVRQLTKLENRGATWIDISPDGSKAAYNLTASTPPGKEEVHIVDTASGADRTVAVDTVGCIQPLATAICFGCYFSCVRTVHLSPDASKVVYSASQTQPIYVLNADGSGALHLPIDRAVLAPSPQRVISRNGLLVFTTGIDVLSANLDGSGMRNLTNFETGAFGGSLYVSGATVSEDGGTIVFQRDVPPFTGQTPTYSQLYTLHPGATPRQLTSDALDASSPSISADGSLVAFIQAGQAFLQRTDGSTPPVRLTNFRYLIPVSVSLSADGSTALVSTGSSIYSVATGVPAKRLFGPRAILPNGIASYSGMSRPSPGSLFRISGWNLQDDDIVLSQGASSPTTTLGGVSVSVNGQPVPLVAVTPAQITAQLPFTIPAGDTKFAVDFTAGQEVTALAEVKDAEPEVLQYVQPFFSSFYAMAFHAGTSTLADQGHPAAVGETLEMYGIGLGAVTPQVNAGTPAPSSPPARAIITPRVRIGNQDATVTYAGLAPGMIGIYQVNAIVPSGLKSGSQTVSWSVAGQSPSVNWTLWLK